MNASALHWIEKLDLIAHPEGGYYKEIYRTRETTEIDKRGARNLSTSIYFLLNSGNVSHFHKLDSDEIWYFHIGSPVTVCMFTVHGIYKEITMGTGNDHELQLIIPAHTIFGAYVNQPDSFTLVSCMVSPGFDFKDFSMSERNELLKQFPQHGQIIRKLTFD